MPQKMHRQLKTRIAFVLPILLWQARAASVHATTILHVDAGLTTGLADGSSWENAFQGRLGLRDALIAARSTADNVEIRVVQGAYAPAGAEGTAQSSFAIGSGVAVYGGFAGTETDRDQRDIAAHPCVLSAILIGAPPPNSRAHHVVQFVGADESAVLDGFIVRDASYGNASAFTDDTTGGGAAVFGGTPTIRNCEFRDNNVAHGSGIGIVGGSPLIENCFIHDNRAEFNGGGIGNFAGGSPIIRNCRFEANIGGQGCGMYNGQRHRFHDPQIQGSPIVIDCDFVNNMGQIGGASGVGIRDDGGATQITRCRFINNVTQAGGGGLYLQNSAATIVSCDFVGNEAPGDGGGAVYVDGHVFDGGPAGTHVPRMTNCRFVGNNGAVISNFGGHCELTHCTIAHNAVAIDFLFWPAVIATPDSSIALRNCVIWGNKPFNSQPGVSAFVLALGMITLDQCCVERWDGTLPGNGNFDLNPLFIDADGADGISGTADDDLQISAGSPCIDAANAAFLPPDTNDLDDDGDMAELLPHDFAGADRFRDCGLDIGAYEHQGAIAHTGDMNADGVVDLDDVPGFVAALLSGAPDCIADTNDDGAVDGRDVEALLNQLL